MKALFYLLIVFMTANIFAQSPYGTWYSTLKSANLPLVFHIQKKGNKTSITVDSPKQKALGMPGEISISKKDVIIVQMKNIGVTFKGTYYDDSIAGVFQQGIIVENMTFLREKIEKEELRRPQNPKMPYAYEVEEIKFLNSIDSIYLAGTFTKPRTDKPFPAIVLVSGSGPQNRDEEMMGHKPFLVLADYLTNLGYGVLRYDDRGTHESEGSFGRATTLDFANDAAAAVHYLMKHEQVNTNQIVVMGHSEGGMIANILGARIKTLSGIVSLAGTSIRGDSILNIQSRLISESMGENENDIHFSQKYNAEVFQSAIQSSSMIDFENKLELISKKWTKILHKKKIIKKSEKKEVTRGVKKTLLNPWMYNFIKYSPSTAIKKISCNVLVLIGSKDIQVTSEENIRGYKYLLPRNSKLQTLKELKGLNHLFQKCRTCTISEYGQLEETFSMDALEEIRDFLQEIWN